MSEEGSRLKDDMLMFAVGLIMGAVVVGGGLVLLMSTRAWEEKKACCEARGGKWHADTCFKDYTEMKP